MPQLLDLFKGGQAITFDKKQNILSAGDKLEQVFYIKSGYMRVYNISDDGDERTLVLLGPGSAFPLSISAYSKDYELTYYYEALSNCELLAVGRTHIQAMLNLSLSTMQIFLEHSARLYKYAVERIDILNTKTAEEKVRKTLIYLAGVCGEPSSTGDTRLKLKLTNSDIASLCNLTRETTSRLMKALEDQKLVTRRGETIRISQRLLNNN